MKRFLPIILLGVLISLVAFSATYFSATTQMRCLTNSKTPELDWLKTEFALSDAEFQRVSQLHEAYKPQCAEMCQRIGEKNSEIRGLLAKSGKITPEIEQKMSESGALRVECQKHMLQHFITVSEAMPKAEGERYLAWVEEQTFSTMGDMGAAKCPACRK